MPITVPSPSVACRTSSPIERLGTGLVERVRVGVERDLLQERRQRRVLLTAVGELAGDADELVQVLHPALRLERALGLEHRAVAGLLEHLLQELRRRRSRRDLA